ncbi:MAG: hypothetical protein CVT64_10605 [Actinobacteria bacterium HGW-Actinobacteria-4]|nr:MAG: hypothetical protein CVT64_10605 [Actinobacteria bacterium HGW-Actinobacteria-4]
MGLLTVYFIAPSDADAAATIDRPGGPGSDAPAPPAPRRGLFRRSTPPAEVANAPAVYPTVNGGGIEPVVQLAQLEAILTGRDFDQVIAELPEDVVVADRAGGQRLVVKVSAALTAALAAASDADLATVAVPWSETEEFWGMGDPEVLTGWLRVIADHSREAAEKQQAVYCWVAV